MTRFTKTNNGKYAVAGHTYEMLIGTRAQVWHGTAYKTSGGLKKSHLFQNKAGRIVSKAKHATAKKEMRLVKAGYGTKKGKFGYVKLSGKSKKMRGGAVAARAAAVNESGSTQGTVAPLVGSQNAGVVGARRGGSRRNSRRHKKGGMVNLPLSPSHYNGEGVGTSGVQLQFVAGQGN